MAQVDPATSDQELIETWRQIERSSFRKPVYQDVAARICANTDTTLRLAGCSGSTDTFSAMIQRNISDWSIQKQILKVASKTRESKDTNGHQNMAMRCMLQYILCVEQKETGLKQSYKWRNLTRMVFSCTMDHR